MDLLRKSVLELFGHPVVYYCPDIVVVVVVVVVVTITCITTMFAIYLNIANFFRLYWTDSVLNTRNSINFDGTMHKAFSHGSQPYGIAVFGVNST